MMENPFKNIHETAPVRKVREVANEVIATNIRLSERMRGALDRFRKGVGLKENIGWRKPDFDLSSELSKRKGPFIEVAGPTLGGFDIVRPKDIKSADKPYFTSNITEGLETYGRKVAPVDFVADARHLPFTDESIGAVFASCLVADIRKEAIQEACRVLEPGGLLVWEGTFSDDIEVAEHSGFALVGYEWPLEKKVSQFLPPETDKADISSLQKKVLQIIQEKVSDSMRIDYDRNSTGEAKIPQDIGKKVLFAHQITPRSCLFQKVGTPSPTE